MKFYPSIFLREVILFGATLALGIFTTLKYLSTLSGVEVLQPSAINTTDVIIFIAILAVVWFISRIPRLAGWMFWIFLCLLVFSGTQIVVLPFVTALWSTIIPLIAVLVFLLVRNVLVHDLAIICAIAGVGAVVGSQITPTFAVLVFIVFSFYDIIAVYSTRHMVQIAQGMIQSGAIFGFVIPPNFKSFFAHRREAQARIGEDFMILGSGDIGLPVIFVSTLVRQSLHEAIFVGVFALIGLLCTHILFMSQSKRAPMAALPPIATMTILGYVISLLLRF